MYSHINLAYCYTYKVVTIETYDILCNDSDNSNFMTQIDINTEIL